jgi:uncharacterized protein (TIGR00730 family)
MNLRAVCVFCGSQSGVRSEYEVAARDTARALARQGIELVYGGGHVGLMGALADEALAAGGRVTGVIPRHLMRPEVAHQGLSELIVVESMHERKRVMADRSDAFVVLPGGYGTFEEMFEMLTWLQLGLQSRPVGVIDTENFFAALVQFLRHAAAEGFIRPQHWDLLIVEPAPELLIARLDLHAARMLGSHSPSEDPARA